MWLQLGMPDGEMATFFCYPHPGPTYLPCNPIPRLKTQNPTLQTTLACTHSPAPPPPLDTHQAICPFPPSLHPPAHRSSIVVRGRCSCRQTGAGWRRSCRCAAP